MAMPMGDIALTQTTNQVMPLLSTCVDRFDKWKTKGMRVSVSMGWHL